MSNPLDTIEQINAAIGLARLSAAYLKTLIEEGIEPPVAAVLTGSYVQALLVAAVAAPQEEQKQEGGE
ncbi:MAG: hypothetical protein ACM33U_07580 [Solirubrobacterales bacterium]|nr:hypothetical protein [Solirubrobacterales bacterium]